MGASETVLLNRWDASRNWDLEDFYQDLNYFWNFKIYKI
jgi:hypothetical protein